MLAKVQELDSKHSQGSIIRNEKALHVLEFVKQGLGSVSTIIGGASGFGIASVVEGALKLVVDVCISCVYRHTKLSDNVNCFRTTVHDMIHFVL